MKERTIIVRVSFDLPVRVGADATDELIQFMIEENSCPGTGSAGVAMDDLAERLAARPTTGICWACNLHGHNKIVNLHPTDEEVQRAYDMLPVHPNSEVEG